MIVDSTGNVGIGTASPSSTLSIKSADDNQLDLDCNSGGRFTSMYFKNNGVLKGQFYYDNSTAKVGFGGGVSGVGVDLIYNSNTIGLTLTNAGLVNIPGTLAVTGAQTFTGATTASTSVTSPLLIGGTGTTSSLTYKTTTGVGTTGADHIFQVGNNGATEAMRILNNGNVGIGTTSPGAKLDVNGTANISGITTFGAQATLKGYTVATLPAGTVGQMVYVTDALAPTFLATVVGGGAITTPCFYNGSNWVGF